MLTLRMRTMRSMQIALGGNVRILSVKVMALKFLYITSDPFTNNSEEFVRILAISTIAVASSAQGAAGNITGILLDNAGNVVAQFEVFTQYSTTEPTAYPYAVSADYMANTIIIIPPGWTFKQFGRAIAVQGSLEEVLRVH
jgi:hypothetical protein